MDTIALQVGIENLTNEQIDKVEQVLKDKEVRTKEDGTRSFFGWLENMRVSFNWKGLYLDGSLSRFFYGDNQYSLNFFTLREAIGKLSVYFGETDHVIPWQTDHLICWRTNVSNAIEALTKVVI